MESMVYIGTKNYVDKFELCDMITMLHERIPTKTGGMDMKINGIASIYDNGEFVTLVTSSGTAIHLPIGLEHSITIFEVHEHLDEEQIMHRSYDVNVDFNQGVTNETSI